MQCRPDETMTHWKLRRGGAGPRLSVPEASIAGPIGRTTDRAEDALVPSPALRLSRLRSVGVAPNRMPAPAKSAYLQRIRSSGYRIPGPVIPTVLGDGILHFAGCPMTHAQREREDPERGRAERRASVTCAALISSVVP